MPNKPIFVVGKEISIDDINVLLSFLGDRFAEHKTLIFNITNCSYKDLNNSTSDKVKFEKLELVGKKDSLTINGNKSFDFTLLSEFSFLGLYFILIMVEQFIVIGLKLFNP